MLPLDMCHVSSLWPSIHIEIERLPRLYVVKACFYHVIVIAASRGWEFLDVRFVAGENQTVLGSGRGRGVYYLHETLGVGLSHTLYDMLVTIIAHFFSYYSQIGQLTCG